MRRLLLLVLLTGCFATAPEKTLDKRSPREERLADLEGKDDYESNWHAAQVCSELADEKSEEQLDETRRRELAKSGLEHAERAIREKPELVEGHFYKMICLGRLCQLTTPSAIEVADLRDEGERTARIDERFECAGAHRFLAIFYSEAPETGPYGYGSIEKACAHFDKALAIAGDCPENLLAAGKFQLEKMENKQGAVGYLKKALETVDTHPGLPADQRASLKKEIHELLDEASD